MTPGLLFPLALGALAAVIVPLIIHIARKSEQHPTDFSAIRWLRQKPRPRSRLRFDEWPLLLTRILLVALVALFLAAPVFFGTQSKRSYIAIVPGADPNGLTLKDAHWIVPGFPTATETPPTGEQPTASLIRQLDAELPTSTPLTIVVPQAMSGTDADRLHLSRKVTWRIVGGTAAYQGLSPTRPPVLVILHDARHRSELRYLSAVARAWQDGPNDVGDLSAPLPGTDVTLAYLSGGTIPAAVLDHVRSGGTTLLPHDALLPQGAAPIPAWRDDDSAPIAEAVVIGRGRLIRFARPLTPGVLPALLDASFPAKVRLLVQTPPAAPTRVMAQDYAPDTVARAFDPPPTDVRPWLALCIAVLFAAERILATRRSRGVVP